ncbi:MAG: cytidylate kinase-like family protein [Eubacteriales bacterium]|nr:cytidylate kinase-like family protein [Eubacteriales bacterium]
MKVITVSRQFGSGGRELGKRLADVLGFDYYDKEIITKLADESGLDFEYVSRVVSNHEWNTVPMNFGTSFVSPGYFAGTNVSLLAGQRKIIEDIAAAGNDCIIVGRNADVILRDYNPFRIFVCADMDCRLARCMKHEKKKEDGGMSEKDVLRNIRRIDKDRSRLRELISGKDRGDSSMYDLVVNSAGWDMDIKKMTSAVAEYAEKWFDRKEA